MQKSLTIDSLSTLLAISCGLIAANIYYAQPLIAPIAAELGLTQSASGLIVTLTQVGYATGLLLIVPLGDYVESRRLAVCLMWLAIVGLVGLAVAPQASIVFLAAFLIGLGSVAVQVLVGFAAYVSPESVRGEVIGKVMGGLMAGIMLARPLSSFLTEIVSWHAVFFLSAGMMFLLMLVLNQVLPRKNPILALNYGALLVSLWTLVLTTPVLQRRALCHMGLYAAFSLFWTAIPLLLAGPVYQLTQGGIALFSLAGGAGVVAAPIAGRIADRGWDSLATVFAILSVALAFLLPIFAPEGTLPSLALLLVAAILLDFGVTTNLVLSQRAIFSLEGEAHNRLNGLFMTAFFIGGAIGSAVAARSYLDGGWEQVAWLGIGGPAMVFAYLVYASVAMRDSGKRFT